MPTLVSINEAKDLNPAYQPLLVAELLMFDGSTLRLASENLDATTGGIQYNGHNWKPRILDENLGALQAVTDNGIIQAPQITLKLADADGFLWNTIENPIAFKGAKLTLKFIFWDAGTESFSSNEQVLFVGIVNAPSETDDTTLTIFATNLLNLSNFNLPAVRIGRTCPWVFPTSKAARVRACSDEDSDEWECGYSPDVTDDDVTDGTSLARGNMDGDVPFTSCGLTFEDCIARMGNSGLPDKSTSESTFVKIEKDSSSRRTGTFGGIHWDPPLSWRGRVYVSGSKDEGVNQSNDAKFNDYFPQLFGKSFVEPPVMQVIGDANSTRFEAVLCVGQVWGFDESEPRTQPGPVEMVIVNDLVVPHVSQSSDKTIFRWEWVNTGSKFGRVNRDANYNGLGDPYGSLACIEIVVPRQVQDSSSVPSIRVLLTGPKLRAWNSTDPTDFDRVITDNAAWITAEILSWAGLRANENIDLQTFIDAAPICDVPVSYTDLFGRDATHPRYSLGFALRQRRTAAEILNNLTTSFKGMLAFDPETGKTQLNIKQTLADQQGMLDKVAGTNDAGPYESVTGTGDDALGYVKYHFSDTNGTILRASEDPNSPSTFKIVQRPISDTPNRVSVSFQNEDYFFSPDNITLVDSGDVGRSRQQVSGGINCEGLKNMDQAKRALQELLATEFRGNPRLTAEGLEDSGGTWIVTLDTTFKAIHLRIGDLVAVTHSKYELDSQLFRVLQIAPTMNCERIALRLQWHEDDWYRDLYGQSPDPLLKQQRRNRLIRPPLGWSPNETAPHADNSIFDPTDKNFGIAELYQSSADGSVLAFLRITGKLPVNDFSKLTSPPYAPEATADDSGGSVPEDHFYLGLVAIDADGKETTMSFPPARIATTNSESKLTLINIYWQDGTVSWKLFGSNNPNKMTLQQTGEGTPDSIEIDAFKRSDESVPDVQFDHLLVKARRIFHAGVFGAAVASVEGATVTLAGVSFADNEWVDHTLSFLGRVDNSDDLPIWDFKVLSNSAATFTLDVSNDLAVDLGIKAGDVVVMRAQPDILTASTIGDTKFVNEVDYFDPPIKIVSASGTPVTLELATPHNYSTGDKLFVKDVANNSGANGMFEDITVPTTPDESYNRTHVILSADSFSTGEVGTGGTVTLVTNGLRASEESQRIFHAIAGKGRGLRFKILDNTTDTLSLDTGGADLTELFDVTTVFIIEEDGWLEQVATTPVINSDPTTPVSLILGVDNYDEQALWVQAYTVSADGRMSIDTDSPGREIWVFGGPGDAESPQFDKATFDISVNTDMEVEDDVAPHYIVRRSGPPSTCRAQLKVPATGTDAILDIILTKFDASFAGSIFGDDKITIPAGSTDLLVLDDTAFADGIFFDEDDILTVNIVQIGSTQPGQTATIVLKWKIG